MNKERFEFQQGTSNKFWEVEVQVKVLTARFGRIGTKGQTKKKSFSSPSAALTEKQKLIQEKTRRGYVPVTASTLTASRPAPTAIAVLQLEEHTQDVAKDKAKWLTKCLQKKITVAQFGKIWENYDEDADKNEGGSVTVVDESLDRMSDSDRSKDALSEYDIFILYRKAVRNGADRFITFDKDSFPSIIALRGDPGAAEIERCIFQGMHLPVTYEGGPSKWPPELGPGTPIQSLKIASDICATLRNGTKVTIKKDLTHLYRPPNSAGTTKVRAKVFVGKKKVREYKYEYINRDIE